MTGVLRDTIACLVALSSVSCEPAELRWLFGPAKQAPYAAPEETSPLYSAQAMAEEPGPDIAVVAKLATPREDFAEWSQWLKLTIENRTGRSLAVRWDESALIDSRGSSHRINWVLDPSMNWQNTRDPSLPGPVLHYVICPEDRVTTGGKHSPACVGWLLDSVGKEAPLSVVLALEIDGREVSQTYRFKIRVTKK